MVEVLQTLLGVLVALLMLGLGATISFQGLKRSIRNWRAPLVGFCCQVRATQSRCAHGTRLPVHLRP